MIGNLRGVTLAAVAALCVGGAAMAQDAARGERSSRVLFGGLINVDALIDNYTRQLARKYNLNDEQRTYTEEFVRQHADQFLDRHEAELMPLVQRMFDARAGGEIDPSELVALGHAAMPVYEDAKLLIVAANDEWRGILNEDQKRIHDEDVRLMYESFEMTEAQLNRMVSGEMTTEEFLNPPRMRPGARRNPGQRPGATTPQSPNQMAQSSTPPPPPPPGVTPGRPGQPAVATPVQPNVPPPQGGGAVQPAVNPRQPAVQQPGGRPARAGRTPTPVRTAQDPSSFETVWDKYVEDFINRYQLNAGQAQNARSVLEACKEQGRQHVRRYKDDLERIDAQLAEARQSKDKAAQEKQQALSAQRAKLVEPLDTIFEKQLKPRLERLPTRAQREAAEKPRTAPAKPAGTGP